MLLQVLRFRVIATGTNLEPLPTLPHRRGRVGRGAAGPVLFVFSRIDAYFAALAKTAVASLGPSASHPLFLHQAKKRAGRPLRGTQNTNARRKAPGVRLRFGPGKVHPAQFTQISSPA